MELVLGEVRRDAAFPLCFQRDHYFHQSGSAKWFPLWDFWRVPARKWPIRTLLVCKGREVGGETWPKRCERGVARDTVQRGQAKRRAGLRSGREQGERLAAGPGFGRGGPECSREPRDSERGGPPSPPLPPVPLPPSVLLGLQDVSPAFGLSRARLRGWSSRRPLPGRSGCYRYYRLRFPFFCRCCICSHCRAGSCIHSRAGYGSRRRHHCRLPGFSREYCLRLARVAHWPSNLQIVKILSEYTACQGKARSKPALRSGGQTEVGGASGLGRYRPSHVKAEEVRLLVGLPLGLTSFQGGRCAFSWPGRNHRADEAPWERWQPRGVEGCDVHCRLSSPLDVGNVFPPQK